MQTRLKKGNQGFILSELFEKSFFSENNIKLKLIKLSDDEIDLNFLGIENPRMFSRRLLHILMFLKQIEFKEKIIDIAPERIGIYCSSNPNLCPLKVIEDRQKEGLTINRSMRLNCNPNHTLVNNGSMLTSHISIQYHIKGPTNFFAEGATTLTGSTLAYQKASFDLRLKIIDLALVICGNFFDDLLSVSNQLKYLESKSKKNYSTTSGLILREAIICSIMDHHSDLDAISISIKNKSKNLMEIKSEHLGLIDTLKTCKYIWGTIHE